MLGNEQLVPLEAAGREDLRIARGFSHTDVAHRTDERLGQPTRIEPLADRARIAGRMLDDGHTERFEPGEPVVEQFPDHSLQAFVTARALRAKVVPFAEAPDDGARQQHRTAGAGSLLVHDRRRPELARASSGGQPGHSRAGDDECP